MTSRDIGPDLGPRIGCDYGDYECWEAASCPQCDTTLGWIYCDHPEADPDDDGDTPGWPECPVCRYPLWNDRNRGMGRLSRVEELPEERDRDDEDDWLDDPPEPPPDDPHPEQLLRRQQRREQMAALRTIPQETARTSPPRNLLDVIVSEIEPDNHQQVARLTLVYSLGDVELRAAIDLVLVALTGWTMPALQAKAEGRFHD